MQSRWRASFFFQSPTNFSFSGASASTNFFHRLALFSMSRSRLRNASMAAKLLIAPQPMLEMNSKGLMQLAE